MSHLGRLAAHRVWLAQLQAAADRPPARPRQPLWWGDAAIGSVDPALPDRMPPGAGGLVPVQRHGEPGHEIQGELTAGLGRLALALRAAGLAHAWRDEQLAVTDAGGAVLGTVERAVVRPLGIATRAVHLLGTCPAGGHWVQQRAFDKPNDPGRWDTLMGGMVPACDTLADALERETLEEAGLRLAQLRKVIHGGTLRTARPCSDDPFGYIVERIDWFRCVVPEGVQPVNQDGEVAQFCRLPPDDLLPALLGGAFTLEAALVFAAHGL